MRSADRIQEFYNAYPFPGRLNAYGPWQEVAPRTLASVGMSPSSVCRARLLDAGCGTGEYARSFAQLGAEVVAIDLSPGALERAASIDRELGFQIDYRQADLLALPEDLGTFQVIISLGVLHHTAQPERAFHNLAERLEPGGHMIIGLYNSVSRKHILAARRLALLLAGGNTERAINIASRLFGRFMPAFVGHDAATERARIADLFANPHERPQSVGSALRWFRDAGLEVVGASPSVSVRDYPSLARLFGGRNTPVSRLLIQMRWLMWNADYFVIAVHKP